MIMINNRCHSLFSHYLGLISFLTRKIIKLVCISACKKSLRTVLKVVHLRYENYVWSNRTTTILSFVLSPYLHHTYAVLIW